jgi:hypothetical protein
MWLDDAYNSHLRDKVKSSTDVDLYPPAAPSNAPLCGHQRLRDWFRACMQLAALPSLVFEPENLNLFSSRSNYSLRMASRRARALVRISSSSSFLLHLFLQNGRLSWATFQPKIQFCAYESVFHKLCQISYLHTGPNYWRACCLTPRSDRDRAILYVLIWNISFVIAWKKRS